MKLLSDQKLTFLSFPVTLTSIYTSPKNAFLWSLFHSESLNNHAFSEIKHLYSFIVYTRTAQIREGNKIMEKQTGDFGCRYCMENLLGPVSKYQQHLALLPLGSPAHP